MTNVRKLANELIASVRAGLARGDYNLAGARRELLALCDALDDAINTGAGATRPTDGAKSST